MEQVTEVRVLDPNTTSFEANGKTYRKSQRVSFARYGLMEQFNLELGYGRTVAELFGEQQKLYGLLNKQQFAECAVSVHNSMNGITRVANRDPHPMFKQCALFWNYEGEDVRYLTDELLDIKVQDWSESGIDAAFFFGQAVSNVPGLLAAYRLLTKGSSEAEASENG